MIQRTTEFPGRPFFDRLLEQTCHDLMLAFQRGFTGAKRFSYCLKCPFPQLPARGRLNWTRYNQPNVPVCSSTNRYFKTTGIYGRGITGPILRLPVSTASTLYIKRTWLERIQQLTNFNSNLSPTSNEFLALTHRIRSVYCIFPLDKCSEIFEDDSTMSVTIGDSPESPSFT